MSDQMVYFFGGGEAEGDASMKALLGGKGANLAEMTNLGIPVPPGFTITTECCAFYSKHRRWPDGLEDQIRAALAGANASASTGDLVGADEEVRLRSGAFLSPAEEVGELAREMNHRFGHKTKRSEEPEQDLALELGDVLFVLLVIANEQGIDLEETLERVLAKYRDRDGDRWTPVEAS